MFEQTFSLADIPRVGVLAFLELLLSADNALVLGLLVRALPHSLRRKALYIGVFSSFLLRAGALLGIAFLLHHLWIQIVGALYLLYLSLRHLLRKKEARSLSPPPSRSFWQTVVLIELFDIAFAIDSILAGIAFIGPASDAATFHPKLWIVYLGGMIGLMGVRTAAQLVSSLLDRFPKLEASAYAIVGWIGIDLILNALQWTFPGASTIFWAGILFFLALGLRSRS